MSTYAASLERPKPAALLRSTAPRTKGSCQCGGHATTGGECAECSRRRAAMGPATRQGSHELTTVLQRHDPTVAKHAPAQTRAECRNPSGRGGGERTTQDAGGAHAAPAAGGAAPVPVAPPAAPARRAELQSGPRYTPNGAVAPAVAGGLKSAGPWDFDGVFKHDPANGIFAGCGEIHQDIKWNAAAAASFTALFGTDVPHAGFPAGHPAGVWIEDRDDHDTRYGRRSGPMSAPVVGGDEYTNAAGLQDMLHGATYHGNDNPSNWPVALAGRWTFMVLAFDMCNHGVQVGSADFITIDW
jgi:hypothetical protein